jgi:hypothetical protein
MISAAIHGSIRRMPQKMSRRVPCVIRTQGVVAIGTPVGNFAPVADIAGPVGSNAGASIRWNMGVVVFENISV